MTALINKTSLITQIDSIIAGLNLSTALTEELSLYYKTAINAGADASTVAAEIISRAENASVSAELEDLLLLAVSVNFITEDRVITVPDLTALNALSNISAGSIYYVESEYAPYIRKSNGSWVLIDPTLQPAVTPNAWSWGDNNNTVLGINDITVASRISPVSVVGGFTDWVALDAGVDHSLGIRANGTAWAWGFVRAIGDNAEITRSSPVLVAGGFTDWEQISAGDQHSAGLRANGTIWTWGTGTNGVLGDNTSSTKSSPVSVVGGFTDWIQVSAGSNTNLALRANGTIWGWGETFSGKLGTNNALEPNRSSPVSVVGGIVDWVQVSASKGFAGPSLGLRANGTLYAWGNNGSGGLGDNSTVNRSSPVLVAGGIVDWVQASAGFRHAFGIRANGTLYAWGWNSTGDLGQNTGSTVSRSSPVLVVGGFTDWVQVSGGDVHNIALRANGVLYAWGQTTGGRLGDNTASLSINRSSPVSVVGGFTNWIQASAGGDHSLGLRGI